METVWEQTFALLNWGKRVLLNGCHTVESKLEKSAWGEKGVGGGGTLIIIIQVATGGKKDEKRLERVAGRKFFQMTPFPPTLSLLLSAERRINIRFCFFLSYDPVSGKVSRFSRQVLPALPWQRHFYRGGDMHSQRKNKKQKKVWLWVGNLQLFFFFFSHFLHKLNEKVKHCLVENYLL